MEGSESQMAHAYEGRFQPPGEQQPPRKRVRKGTRSCWECKHRKVKCNFASDTDLSCRECLNRGSACTSQDLPAPDNPRESERASLNDRLSRVEGLLENVVDKLDSFISTDRTAPSNRSYDSPRAQNLANNSPDNENAPVLSLFDNEVLRFRRAETHEPSIVNTLPVPNAISDSRQNLRLQLLALLPSQDTIQKLAESNNCWWLCRKQCFQDDERLITSIPIAHLSNSPPDVIAKVLLWISISLQQLPLLSFDVKSLTLSIPPAQFIDTCMDLVSRSVCSDELLIRSIDGLECLVLQGIMHNNDGKLRSAWLSYRRALNVAQLIGLHNHFPAKADALSSARNQHILNHIVSADRYLSLMLGMYHGIGDGVLNQQGPDSIEVSDEQPMSTLCRIAGSIIERNHKFRSVTPDMLRITQLIDSELWSIDPQAELSGTLVSDSCLGKTAEEASIYAKLMAQLWHYQLLAWLHLPLFLEPRPKKRYSYHHETYLNASRRMIKCYTSIRRVTSESFCCKSLDFQAFTAAVTLLLNLLRSTESPSSISEDWSFIEEVMAVLSRLAKSEPSGKVATRGLNVLQTLKNVATGTGELSSEPIKLDIPYFGTIILDKDLSRRSNQQSTASATIPIISESQGSLNDLSARGSNFETEINDTQAPSTMLPWSDSQVGFDSIADCWTFDPDLAMMPPFPSDFDDDWGLGL